MDQVLNLSAFGDVIEDPEKRKGQEFADFTFGSSRKKEDGESHEVSVPNSLAKEALKHSAQIKMFHWQTRSYAEHKALDKLFGGLTDLTDGLIESLMGKYGRPDFGGGCSVEIMDYSEENLRNYMESLYSCYAEECKGKLNPDQDSEIINIIDEIVALVDKTKYLLSLK